MFLAFDGSPKIIFYVVKLNILYSQDKCYYITALTLWNMTLNHVSLSLKSKFSDLQSHTFTFIDHLAMSKKKTQPYFHFLFEKNPLYTGYGSSVSAAHLEDEMQYVLCLLAVDCTTQQ